MTGWLPRDLIVATDQEACSLRAWVTRLGERTARVRDLVEAEFSTTDSVVEVSEQSAYDVDAVLLRQPTRQRKLAPLYETGWMVKRVVGPSTFVIRHVNGGEKVINADLLKPSPSQPVAAGDPSDGDDTPAEHGVEPIAGRHVYGLRDRRDVRPPPRDACACVLSCSLPLCLDKSIVIYCTVVALHWTYYCMVLRLHDFLPALQLGTFCRCVLVYTALVDFRCCTARAAALHVQLHCTCSCTLERASLVVCVPAPTRGRWACVFAPTRVVGAFS